MTSFLSKIMRVWICQGSPGTHDKEYSCNRKRPTVSPFSESLKGEVNGYGSSSDDSKCVDYLIWKDLLGSCNTILAFFLTMKKCWTLMVAVRQHKIHTWFLAFTVVGKEWNYWNLRKLYRPKIRRLVKRSMCFFY